VIDLVTSRSILNNMAQLLAPTTTSFANTSGKAVVSGITMGIVQKVASLSPFMTLTGKSMTILFQAVKQLLNSACLGSLMLNYT